MTLATREAEITDLVAQGKPNKLIAYELGITEGTVKQYVSLLFKKTGTANRTQLALWTLRHTSGRLF